MKMTKKTLFVLALACMLLAAALAFADEHTHTFGDWCTTVNPTCSTKGTAARTCSSCGYMEYKELSPYSHSYQLVKVTVNPYCWRAGQYLAKCSVCGYEAYGTLDPLPHNYGRKILVQEATCTQRGEYRRTCSECGLVTYYKTEKAPHTVYDYTVTKEATCTREGTKEGVCEECGSTVYQTIAKVPHTYTDWVVTKEPNGKVKGTRTSTCTVCGQQVTERFFYDGTLFEGLHKDARVAVMQGMMKDCDTFWCKLSGGYGEQTTYGVKLMQELCKLPRTGVADPATLSAIQDYWQKKMGLNAGIPQSGYVYAGDHTHTNNGETTSCVYNERQAGKYTVYTCEQCGYAYTQMDTELGGITIELK